MIDHAVLPQLVADRGHKRNRELGRAADLANRDRLEPGHGADDVHDSRRPLGEADDRGNLVDDCVRVARCDGRRADQSILVITVCTTERSASSRSAINASTRRRSRART